MANPAEVKARGEMLDAMLNEYHDAIGNGCDASGAYDCMVEVAHSFLIVTQEDPARVAPTEPTEYERALDAYAKAVGELFLALQRVKPEP